MPQPAKKSLVACVGNLLLLDEGFGPHMAQVLTNRDTARRYFDDEHAQLLVSMFREDSVHAVDDGRIPVLDAGTMGMGLLRWIKEYECIVVLDIIDCKSADIAPGTVLTLTPEQMAESTVMHSLHDLKVADVLANARLAGYDVECTCICAQAKDYEPADFVVGLTPELEAAVPVAVGALMQALGLEQ